MKYRIVKIIDEFYIQRKNGFFNGWKYLFLDYEGLHFYKNISDGCICFKTSDEAEIFFREKLQPKVIKVLD
jgi:hypothetical protein